MSDAARTVWQQLGEKPLTAADREVAAITETLIRDYEAVIEVTCRPLTGWLGDSQRFEPKAKGSFG